ncbi:MAG: thioredoxin-like domain-containing protein [Verrucomicrobia bacterium]|nr:thioredoxin-like domain-containing protein [Verrucomicrobiota bacterium]
MNQILRIGLLSFTLGIVAQSVSRADFFGDLQPKLISAKGAKAEPFTQEGASPKYTAIYYSAHWCPPCRAFTPKLVKWYNEFQPKHKEFQLVFVSSDKDEAAMLGYMTEMKMPWPAVRFLEKEGSAVEKFSSDGIPYLVLLDENGKDLTGKAGNDWQAPQEILKKIEEIVGSKK